jgi:hypothetical protein
VSPVVDIDRKALAVDQRRERLVSQLRDRVALRRSRLEQGDATWIGLARVESNIAACINETLARYGASEHILWKLP